MLNTTLPRLKCLCGGALELKPKEVLGTGPAPEVFEVRSGHLACRECRSAFLILAGVALLVQDPHEYLLTHVKGISRLVADAEIPAEIREDFVEAKAELQAEHIEEDLEAERVNALYLMNHYLRVRGGPETDWWKPKTGAASPLIDQLVREHWDQGPFARIGDWVAGLSAKKRLANAVEIGCGVGGLYQILRESCDGYLGVDSSFAGVALGRHLALGVPYPASLRIPEDLLQGPVSREVRIPAAARYDGRADFVVADLQRPPLESGSWDLALALNAIDMLDEPAELPRLQHDLLAPGGIAIQSCPYIWHEAVARALRAELPAGIRESSRAVEWLYRRAGFEIGESLEHVPWLFFKHVRQLEIYSVHLLTARKAEPRGPASSRRS